MQGRSASEQNPFGIRRRLKDGTVLLPGAWRKGGHRFIGQATPKELEKLNEKGLWPEPRHD